MLAHERVAEDRGFPSPIVFANYPLLRWTGVPFAGYGAALFYGWPPDIGGPLPVTYLCWILGAVLLYFPCRWFAGIKARRRDWWLGYL